ncbi:MAG TPA: D-alanyl-D-alanine carboxypeptidase/D-alanyl-D-alanine-endopeptidase [Burkholderiaceae bacterium]
MLHRLLLVALLAAPLWAQAQSFALPPEVDAALARAKLPRDAVTLLVADAQGRQPPRLAWRAQVPVNPASVMKLVTTYAGLDLLGPAYAWNTPVYVAGTLRGSTLEGNVYIQGRGDPKLVVERLWLQLRRLRGLGIQDIAGDIVLDRSAFALPAHDPASFDGEPQKPYNAAPDALLVNFRSLVLTFTPDRAAGLARISTEPPLAGVQIPASVALSAPGPECGDWRGALRAELGDPARMVFQGVFPASCGERAWPVAYADPASYAARAVEGLWRELGGRLGGQVREGSVPPDLLPAFSVSSPPLAEVIRDINKYSNNVMAQQLFLTLSLQQKGLGTFEGSRDVLRQWWRERLPDADPPVLDNGAGLSREARISAWALARLLQHAWQSPLMPELVSSLPITGVDGTMRRSQARSGTAHLKTGSLRDVAAAAGYVHATNGRRYVLVAIANHPNAAGLRPAIDALIDWTAQLKE